MSRRSKITVLVSDIHFPHHVPEAWEAFCEFHSEVRPYRTIINGDFVDLGQLSRFEQDPEGERYVIPEIVMFAEQANALAEECEELVIVEGNHEARWSRILGDHAIALRGAAGLTFREQCHFQGLTTNAKWFRENAANRGIRVGQFFVRHGDKDFGRYGAGKHAASSLIDKTNGGESIVVGHLHQCQMIVRQRADGVYLTAILNGTFEKKQDYAPGASWVCSFTVLEEHPSGRVTAHPVVIEDGVFAYGGRVYDGNEILRQRGSSAPQPPRRASEVSDVMLPSKPPYPAYIIPHTEAPVPPSAMDYADKLVSELAATRLEAIDALDRFDASVGPVERDALLPAVQRLPVPSSVPRDETPTVNDHPRKTTVTHPLTGESGTKTWWARRLGIARTTLNSRLDRAARDPSYSLEEALKPPSIAA